MESGIGVTALTIAYVTSRRDPKIEWFFDSLAKQLPDDNIRIVLVDSYYGTPMEFHSCEEDRNRQIWLKFESALREKTKYQFKHVPPKPNVWSGQYRLTSQDWFSASNARNTALCLCETSHIAYVDDLSVLMPGWLDAAREAVSGDYIACGAYMKVKGLIVKDGVPVHYESTESGMDDRLRRASEDVSPCTGGWLYGCSMVAPVEDLLEAGGWPEYVDGMGAEDYILGIALTNAGKHLKYDKRLLTLESEELHFAEPPMKKTDKGVSPNDKSHAALKIAQQSKYFPNYYPGGMRALREHVLNGGEFPTAQIPDRDWFDGQLISEM